MGKFQGVLIASDFDNTMVYTEDALLSGGILPPLSRANREAITYFMAEGGTFSVATGRALPSFVPIAPTLPMNGPSIIFNGAAIFDFSTKQYLAHISLPEAVRPCVEQLEEEFPGVSYEAYHENGDAYMVHPSDLMRNHARLNRIPSTQLESISQMPSPISKIVFEETAERCAALEAYIRRQPWGKDYEVMKSGKYFLEITAKGATKGGMVEKLAQILGIQQENVCCVGDQANDISMLLYARHAFAPANSVEAVQNTPGVELLPHCREDAIAEMIRRLDCLY